MGECPVPVLYFAYGSNLLPGRLLARTPSARFLAPACSPGWDLSFDKLGTDGSGKATLVEAADGEVPGVLVDLAGTELPALDRCETGYRRIETDVLSAGTWRRALTYLALPEHVRPGTAPWSWYRDVVVAGARVHRLPAAWIRRLEAVRAAPDPSRGRDRRMRRLLDGVPTKTDRSTLPPTAPPIGLARP